MPGANTLGVPSGFACVRTSWPVMRSITGKNWKSLKSPSATILSSVAEALPRMPSTYWLTVSAWPSRSLLPPEDCAAPFSGSA